MNFDADVLIVGAGPAGLSLAAALGAHGLAAQVLEQAPLATLQNPAEDGREIALTHRARRIMEGLGLWGHLSEADISPLREARVLDGDAPEALRFAATGGGLDALGWLVPNHRIRQAALAAARPHTSVRLECDARVTGLRRDADAAEVQLADGRCLRAPLVVAADSRFSPLRRMAGIGASVHDFARSVVVGRVRHEGPNQGIAWECFRYGNTLALLPLNGGMSSAVVTLPSDQAPDWLALDDAGFAARIQAQAPPALGAMQAAGPRHHYPLVGVYAHRFHAERFALVGDAAVGMHPVTAHGYNFGLYGVEGMARCLGQAARAGRDIGHAHVLAPYEAEHRRTTGPTYLGTNAVVTLFTSEQPAARVLRRAVLRASEAAPGFSQLVKAAVTRQLTGRAAHRAATGP